jgi:hypothetical protein
VFIGFVLFMIHTRARYADAMAVSQEPTVDGDWLESATAEYKQANQPHRRNKFLLLVGPACGVSGKPWASTWLALRLRLGLVAAKGMPMMPAHGAGGAYTTAKLSLWDFTLWLRDVLVGLGEDPASKFMSETGSHSCKATTLSWMSKAGMGKDDRKWLGGHLERNEVSMASYSRDMLSGPLRRMLRLYKAMQSGEFEPDLSRSGQWRSEAAADAIVGDAALNRERPDGKVQRELERPGAPGADEVPVLPAAVARSISSPSSSSSSSSSSSAETQSSKSSEGAPEEALEAMEGARKKWKGSGIQGQPLWRHLRTKVFHIQRVGENVLACSRPLDNYELANEAHFTYPRCRICFGTELAMIAQSRV